MLLAVFFFCSGLSALIYQVLWLRMLGWVFGVTIYAASAVWAAFMAGLAIGSYAAGVAGDRVRNPLRWFGATEILIGATALATPNVLEALQSLYVRLYPSLPDGIAALTTARLIIAFAVLIVPTVLMGATLPLVLKASTFRASSLVEQVGVLYGSNAAGAIVGTLAAGLVPDSRTRHRADIFRRRWPERPRRRQRCRAIDVRAPRRARVRGCRIRGERS